MLHTLFIRELALEGLPNACPSQCEDHTTDAATDRGAGPGGLDAAAIAETLGLSVRTVAKWVGRARHAARTDRGSVGV